MTIGGGTVGAALALVPTASAVDRVSGSLATAIVPYAAMPAASTARNLARIAVAFITGHEMQEVRATLSVSRRATNGRRALRREGVDARDPRVRLAAARGDSRAGHVAI
jgi:hypothetical protein